MKMVDCAGSRRRFLQNTLLFGGALVLGNRVVGAAEPASAAAAPIRAITRGPKHHWFGYYDKQLFDPTGRYVLGMEVDFEGRSPRPDDVIRVGMVDLQDHDRWIELGQSSAWCWQQGCMLQWRPGSSSEVLWNDREDGRYVCRLLDVVSGRRRTIPHPIYTLSPDGRWAIAPDFARLNDCRPGYGYVGLPDPHRDELAPEGSGLFRIDLETGDSRLLLSLAEMVRVPAVQGDLSRAKHWCNHLLVNPDGTRIEFLHRWRPQGETQFSTRMFTASPEGKELRVIDPSGDTSHFIWRDPQHILAWTSHPSHGFGFYLFEDRQGGTVEIVGPEAMQANGHCTYLPGNAWILNDSYPQGEERRQQLYLYQIATHRRVELGQYPSPPAYGPAEWRCDLHPCSSPDGRSVLIESPHGGEGRQLYLVDISAVVG